jgi:hypothetical protein
MKKVTRKGGFKPASAPTTITDMSARELKARDERKDTVALLAGTTLVGGFLMGALIWWPGAAITVTLGVFALSQALRRP